MGSASEVAKAIAGAIGAGVTYLIGVIGAEGTFSDVSTVQWLGLVPVLLGAFGVVWSTPDSMSQVRRERRSSR